MGRDEHEPNRSARSHRGPAGSSFLAAAILFAVVNIALIPRLGDWTSPVEQAFAPGGKALSMERTFTWWVTKAYIERATAPDIVLMGSSQMGSATFAADARQQMRVLDFVVDRTGSTLAAKLADRLGGEPAVFNWSMGGAMVSDAYMIGRSLFHDGRRPKLVVIGLNPRDFIDNSLTYPGITEPFRFFSQFVDAGPLTAVAIPDFFPRFEWYWERLTPLRRLKPPAPREPALVGGSGPAAGAGNQLLRGVSGGAGEVAPGQWLLPANMPYIFVDNTREYTRRYKNANPPIYRGEIVFFREFLKLMQERGIKVLVVGMPSLSTNRALLPAAFWQGWRQEVASACAEHGARWHDLTDSSRFEMDDFLDTVHMNAYGGDKLFSIVAGDITGSPDMVAALRARPDRERALAGPVSATH